MDPRSGTPSPPDPAAPSVSEGNGELPCRDPARLASAAATASSDLPSCVSGAPSKPAQELSVARQPPDAPSASSSSSSSSSKPSAERAHKASTASPNKKNNHSPENRSSLQKPSQSNRSSTQSRNVQWVRVSPQTQKVSDSTTHDIGGSGKHAVCDSSSTLARQNEASSSSDMPQHPALSSLVVSETQAAEDIKAVDESTGRSSTEVAGDVESLLSTSRKSSDDGWVSQLALNENVEKEVTQDDTIPNLIPKDIEVGVAGPVFEATNDNDNSANDVSLAIEEQLIPSAMYAGSAEDEQILELQQGLSRTSSLSARAREFVPKSATPPPTAPALPPQPLQPPQIHVVPPPLVVPLNAAPGILPMFSLSSPLPSPPLAVFPLPMVGPPPPPIPIMRPMALLGPPLPGILNVGPPPPPIIPSSPYLIHSSSSNLPVPPQLTAVPVVEDRSIETLGYQPVKLSGEVLQDQHQPQELDLSATQPDSMKPMPTEELRAKIVKQVEYYFSDVNLPTDYHLMKFVKKDPEGFVPISIVANFRRVRNLTKNYSVVASALCSSTQLVVSSDCKKVRRLHPLQIDLEEIQSRTVVAENLPPDYSIESLQELFGSVGNVKVVRICEPEAINGSYQTKLSKADMVVCNKLHALVEYETVEQAERAVAELTDQGNWRRALRVRLLLRRTTKQAPKSHKLNEGADGSATEDDVTPPSSETSVERTREEEQTKERPEEALGGDQSQIDAALKKGRGRGRVGRGRGRGHLPNGSRSHPVGTPPQANSLSNFEPKPPLGPRMPDGTRGFTSGRGKVMPTNCV